MLEIKSQRQKSLLIRTHGAIKSDEIKILLSKDMNLVLKYFGGV